MRNVAVAHVGRFSQRKVTIRVGFARRTPDAQRGKAATSVLLSLSAELSALRRNFGLRRGLRAQQFLRAPRKFLGEAKQLMPAHLILPPAA
jgi:hypothetical protein